VFDERRLPSPFAEPTIADRTVAISSISKSHAATGFRSGWAVASRETAEALLPLSETMLFGNQPFIADMTAFALNTDLPTSAKMRADYRRRAMLFADRLEAVCGMVAYRPQAGMFIIVDVSGTGLDGDSFARRLLNAGVAVMPGSSFGANALGLIRLSLTVPDESVEEACRSHRRVRGGAAMSNRHADRRRGAGRNARAGRRRHGVWYPRCPHYRTLSRPGRKFDPHMSRRATNRARASWRTAMRASADGRACAFLITGPGVTNVHHRDGAGARRQHSDAGDFGRQCHSDTRPGTRASA
jgi:hypothetical protein